MSELVTMSSADSRRNSKAPLGDKVSEGYESDADMTDEEILDGLGEITALSLSDALKDEPAYE